MKQSAIYSLTQGVAVRHGSENDSDVPRMTWRVREFCVAFKISNSTFWKYVSLGKIRIIRIGGRVLIPATEADRILSGRE